MQNTTTGARHEDLTAKFSNLSVVDPKVPSSSSEGAREDGDGEISAVLQYQGPCYNSAYVRAMEAVDTQSHASKATQLLAHYHSENQDSPITKGCVSGRSKGRGGVKERKSSAGVKSEGEKYEKYEARHGDKAFLKFQKELANCPQQIIRQAK